LAFESGFLFGNDTLFAMGFDTRHGLYIGFDGRVQLGEIQPGWREYLVLMNQWHRDGLLNPDVFTLNLGQVTAIMSTGQAGASIGWIGSRMGGWIPPGKANNPNFTLVATPIPTRQRGQTANFSPVGQRFNFAGGCVAITTEARNLDAAIRLLDFGYSEEGIMYFTYGTLGTSYTMVNGIPTYTPLITNHPQGWPMGQALGAWTRANHTAPSIPDGRYIMQFYEFQEQRDALGMLIPAGFDRLIPPLTPTPDEMREYAQIMNDITTYIAEMNTRFVLGTESFGNWDAFTRQVNNMGLPRALQIQNAAMERFNRR
jgi:putative aldouronate transport system substrate-binding protein